MTVATTDSRFIYSASGAGPYSFPRKLASQDDLKVRVDGVLQTLNTHYTVSLTGSSPIYDSATVTFVTAPSSGAEVEIFRDPALTQEVSTSSLSGATALDTIADQFDRIEFKLQALANKVSRAPVVQQGAATDFSGLMNDVDLDGKAGYAAIINGAEDGWTLGVPAAGATVSATMVPFVSAASLNAAATTFSFTAPHGTTARTLRERFGDVLNVKDFGAVGDAINGTTGVATASDATFTDANASWTSADVGKAIRINGAGAAGADLTTTIASVNSATSIELTDAAITTVASNAVYVYGTNDTTAVQAWIDAVRSNAKIGFAPDGDYLCDALTFGPLVQANLSGLYGTDANTCRFIKLTNDTSPLITFNASSATTYLTGITIQNIAFVGRNLAPAVRTYSMVRSEFVGCEMTGGTIGVEQFGGVGVEYHNCGMHGNGVGLKITKYSAAIGDGYPNLTVVRGGYYTDNTTVGIDFDYGIVLNLFAVDIEGNGTAATANNGNILIGPNIGEAISGEGVGVVMVGGWLEDGDGEAAVICKSGLNAFSGVFVHGNGSTYDFKFDGGRYVLRDISGLTAKATSVLEDAACGTPNIIDNVKLGGALSVTAEGAFVIAPNAAQMRVPTGAAAAPSYAFSGDTDTGAYNRAPNEFAIATGGQLGFIFYGGASPVFDSLGRIYAGDGTEGAPAFAFRNDADNGIYRIGANNWGISVGGSILMDFAAAGPNLASGKVLKVGGTQVIGAQQPAIANLVWTYSANDPGTTPNSATTFADGTALVAATVYEALDEIEAKVNAILAAMRAHGLIAT